MVLIGAALVIGVTGIFLRTASIPYKRFTCASSVLISETSSGVASCTKESAYLSLSASIPIYVIGVITFLGWYGFPTHNPAE